MHRYDTKLTLDTFNVAIDIDECASNNGGCDPKANCTNQYGAPPNCSACPIGYTGTGKTVCTYIDPCTVNNGGCDKLTNCSSTEGGPVVCTPCPPGYSGTPNVICSGIFPFFHYLSSSFAHHLLQLLMCVRQTMVDATL